MGTARDQCRGQGPAVDAQQPAGYRQAAGQQRPWQIHLHGLPALSKVLATSEMAQYERDGVVQHPEWKQRRIDFQPYPYASYTEELVKALQNTYVEGNTAFLEKLDPSFVARDLVDDRFVKQALQQVGGLKAFGYAESFTRQEVIAP